MPPIVLTNRENRLVFRDPRHLLYVMRDINGGHRGHRRRQNPSLSAAPLASLFARWSGGPMTLHIP